MKPTLQDALNHGAQLMRAGNFAEAKKLADALLERLPESPPVRLFAADVASGMGDVEVAFAHLDALPDSGPEHVEGLLRKARLLFADGQRSAALGVARMASSAIAGDPRRMRVLAGILRDCQQLESAHGWLAQALVLAPDDPGILYDLAVAEFHLNRPDDAEGHLARLLEVQPDHGAALHLRSALRTQRADSNHLTDLRRRLAEAPADPRLIATAQYALAKELEDLGDYQAAVTALDAGARAARSVLSYDSDREITAHEEIRSVFSRQAFEALPAGYADERPIFIVGMPRTGTTLVERILAGHSQVISIGEFTEFPRLYSLRLRAQLARHAGDSPSQASLKIDFAELGQSYCRAARELAGDTSRFVDKLPYNFLYCGYILAALPNARLIHLTRHPLDTCYAVYKTLFFGAYSFSYDLDELASYYVSYHRHMAHWHAVLPGRILDVPYEGLVREPDTEVRSIIDWCDLPWEPSVLEFDRQEGPSMTASAMQVRQPVHTGSIGSWRRAEAHFARLRSRFEAAGILP